MRLWHEALIPYLSNKRLSGQHRECCALRGNGWGRKHKTVDYVFTHSHSMLFAYHQKVMNEMLKRGFHIDPQWFVYEYRGKNYNEKVVIIYQCYEPLGRPYIYPEHNDAYLKECLELLDKKGEHIEWKQELK